VLDGSRRTDMLLTYATKRARRATL
jgi:hypothetical protein